MTDVVIVSACRTAVGAFGGTLKDSTAAKLGSVVMKEAVKRAGIDPALIDDVRMGCLPGTSGRPERGPGCCPAGGDPRYRYGGHYQPGMHLRDGGSSIRGGHDQGRGWPMSSSGVASNTCPVPNMRPKVHAGGAGCRTSPRGHDDSCASCRLAGVAPAGIGQRHRKCGLPREFFKGKPYIMGHTAEFIAQMLNISREEMDEVALRSHNNAERATKEGDFKEEIVPVEIPQKKGKPPIIFDKDEHFRPGITLEQLAALPPAFLPKIGKVTAANSSGINDGASAMIIMSAEKAKELGIKPIARIRSMGRGACHPAVMGLSPVPAVHDLFRRDGKLKMEDFELIELNEAFAAQYLGCEIELGLNREITNVNGSGIGPGPSGGIDGLPHDGDPAARHEEAWQDLGSGDHLRRRRRVHGDCHRNAVTSLLLKGKSIIR